MIEIGNTVILTEEAKQRQELTKFNYAKVIDFTKGCNCFISPSKMKIHFENMNLCPNPTDIAILDNGLTYNICWLEKVIIREL